LLRTESVDPAVSLAGTTAVIAVVALPVNGGNHDLQRWSWLAPPEDALRSDMRGN
jgi:hypothetical protein